MASKGLLFVVMIALFFGAQARASTFQDTLTSALADAKSRRADSEVTFITNIIDASNKVRAEHLSAVKQCKIGTLEGELRQDKDLAKRLIGRVTNDVAKRLLPTLMGALSSAKGAALGVLLTDGGLTPDPFATVDAAYATNTHFTRDQLRDAARGTFQTNTQAFKTLEVKRKAAAFACLL